MSMYTCTHTRTHTYSHTHTHTHTRIGGMSAGAAPGVLERDSCCQPPPPRTRQILQIQRCVFFSYSVWAYCCGCMHMYVLCMHACMYCVCMHMCMHICVCMHIPVCVYRGCMHMYVLCMHICVYLCVYAHTCVSRMYAYACFVNDAHTMHIYVCGECMPTL